jgi:hypothetical protein
MLILLKLHKTVNRRRQKCVDIKTNLLSYGYLLNVAAELKIDVSPMEGFVPEK